MIIDCGLNMEHRFHVWMSFDGCCLKIEYVPQEGHLEEMNWVNVEFH